MSWFKSLLIGLTTVNKYLKALILVFVDSMVLLFSWALFLPIKYYSGVEQYLLFNFEIILYSIDSYFFSLFIYLVSMHILRALKEIVRNFSLQTILSIFFSSILFSICLFASEFYKSSEELVYSVNFLFLNAAATGALGFTIIVLSRLIFRFLINNENIKKHKKILIFGTGQAAQELFSSLEIERKTTITGFISVDNQSIGREMFGKPIYSMKNARNIWKKDNNIQLYIASRSITNKDMEELVNICEDLGVKVKKISSFASMLREKEVSLVDLNISDIIPRTNLDDFESELDALKGKKVLITGAGGSIGSQITRILANSDVGEIYLADISESALFQISEEAKDLNSELKLKSVIMDVKNKEKCIDIIKIFKPDIVYHAAAYKHVPLLESELNFKEAFKNNFIGTCNIAEASADLGVEKFIFISTDKAVRPTNYMGASKRMAEIFIQSLNLKSETLLISVRFGNVMDSSGSVIPTFRKQIKNGGPVTVTHPEIIRYFMTIGEAAYLVIMASIIAKNSAVYMLKMGQPVKISEIAKRLIKLSGNTIKDDSNDEGIEIIYTGLRSGEKLYEELLVNDSDLETQHPKIFMDQGNKNITMDELTEVKSKILQSLEINDEKTLKETLRHYADYGIDKDENTG